jgi:hypothetical protein
MTAPPAVKPTVAEDQRKYLRDKVGSELTFLWNESEVPLDVQVDIAWAGYKQVRRFASWADDRATLREALRDDVGIDVNAVGATGIANRFKAASVICAWEMAAESIASENKLRAEAKSQQIVRPMTTQERGAMRKSYEGKWGKLPQNEVPSAEYVATKLEETEQEEPVASPLDEVSSVEDAETQQLSATLDLTGRLRITKQKAKGKMPSTSEELRLRLRLEGNVWMFMAQKFTAKTWLQELKPETWSRYADYLLGEKVYNLKVPAATNESMDAIKVPWPVVLHYEYEIRKKALKECREMGTSLDQALSDAMKDSELKEVHFTSPLALMGRKRINDDTKEWGKDKWLKKEGGKGKKEGGGAKGKGKGKKEGGKGAKAGKQQLVGNTADGRQICFAFNNTSGCSTASCGRVHCCRVKGCGATDHGCHAHPVV